MRVLFQTFGCKANQYDTERMRQELEARGARVAEGAGEADLCVVNTCTVTNQAVAEARRWMRRVRRENPEVRIVVAGCSAAVRPDRYRSADGVVGVVEGHDPVEVAEASFLGLGGGEGLGEVEGLRTASAGASAGGAAQAPLVPLRRGNRPSERRTSRGSDSPLLPDTALLRERRAATRGWLKIQDGCDRKCSFCETRLARGPSRSRPPGEIVAEAKLLARSHPELVLTGIHIGHYGRDLPERSSLARLVSLLLEEVPEVRFRLGSVEATEVDDLLLERLADSGGRLAPHLHMPLQSGSDRILRRMRRWHDRETYRRRTWEIAERLGVLGLGADVITGFPGETAEDHLRTRELVEELPFTYLHVFPFSPRPGTAAADLDGKVPQRVAGERARELREIALEKGKRYRRERAGAVARVVLEGGGRQALTEDYLRVAVRGEGPPSAPDRSAGILLARLRPEGEHLYIDLSQPLAPLTEGGPSAQEG